jgi:hypothetical protein
VTLIYDPVIEAQGLEKPGGKPKEDSGAETEFRAKTGIQLSPPL